MLSLRARFSAGMMPARPRPEAAAGLASTALALALALGVALVGAAVAPRRAAAAGNTWSSIGPSGGAVVSLAVNPADTGTAFAATGGAGLFKTTDGGATWSHSDAGLLPNQIAVVAIDPAPGGRVMAGTLDGLWTSTDGGATWMPPAAAVSSIVTCITVSPHSALTVYACDGGRLRRSDDGGAAWVRVGQPLPGGAQLQALAVDPFAPATLYGGTDGGVFRSVNGGVSWVKVVQGLGPNGPDVTTIVADPLQRGTVYAGVEQTVGTPPGLYVSRNGGASWSLLFSSPSGGGVSCLAILPPPGKQLFACSNGLFRSGNGGKTWQPVGGGLEGLSIGSLAVAAAAPSELFAGVFLETNSGPAVFKSTNTGAAWSAAGEGIAALWIPAMVADAVAPDTVLAGTQEAGLMRTDNGGGIWTRITNGLGGTGVGALAADPLAIGTFYINTNRAFFASQDDGLSWLHPGARFLADGPLLVAPTAPRSTLYTIDSVTAHLARSVDGGATWTQLDPLVPGVVMAAAPSDPATLYVALFSPRFGGGLLVSHDGGTTFANLFTFGEVRAIVVDPDDANTLYVSGGTLRGAGGVFKSQDGGATFTQLPGIPQMGAMLIKPSDPTVIYGGTFGGGAEDVLVSRDGGATWSRLAPGFPGFLVTQLSWGGDTLYAATQGASVWAISGQ